MGGGHSRSQLAGWRAHAHSAQKTRRRTAKGRARVDLGSALGGSTRMRQGAADQKRAHARGGWRRATRERALAEQGSGPPGSTRAGQRRARKAHWHASRVADREEARARGRRRRTGRELARAAERGTPRGSARTRRCAGAGEAASDRWLSLLIAHGAMRAVDLPLLTTQRVTRRRCGVDTVDAAAWRPRGRRGRRGVPTGRRRS